MSEVVTGIIAFGAAALGGVLGGVLGYRGSMNAAREAIEENRKKDSFEITKGDLETRIRGLSILRRECDSYLRAGYKQGDPKALASTFRGLVVGISDALVETPWVFSHDMENLELDMKRSLSLIEGAFNKEVRPLIEELLGLDTQGVYQRALEESRALDKNIKDMRSLAESERNLLIEEHKNLLQQRKTK